MSNLTLAQSQNSRRYFALSVSSLRVASLYVVGMLTCLASLGFATIKPGSFLAFAGDNLGVLTFIKTYMNGDGFRINTRLGFPGVQDNTFFPSFDFSYRAVLRLIAPFVNEAFTAYYLLQLLGAAAVFLAAALALRWLGFRHWLAILGGIVFIVSPYYAWRALGHDFLALSFSVPLGAALAIKLGSWQSEMTVRSFAVSFGVVAMLLIIATSGLYYAFFSVMFIAFAGIIGAAASRRVAPLVMVCISVAVIFPVLVITGFGSAIGEVVTGAVPTIKRTAEAQLSLGLNLAEAVYVLKDIKPLRWALTEFDGFRTALSQVVVYEWPGVFLTLVIFASPILLPVLGSIQTNRSAWLKLIYISLACIVFGIIYSVSGGLAYFFNLFVAPEIRATQRIMPFLAFFSIVIVLASVEMLLRAGSARCAAVAAVVIGALLLSMAPDLNALARHQKLNAALLPIVDSTKHMLAAKDQAHLSAVLQLPHAIWPEPPAFIRTFHPMSHMEGFVLDRKGSTTRWSYGSAPYQQSWIEVRNLVDQHAKSGLPSAAVGMGFDSILIEKRAYDDAELQVWRANIEADKSCKLFEDNVRVLYRIGSACQG